jgi:hypothetical protein
MSLINVWMCRLGQHAVQAITADMLQRGWDEFVYCVDVSCGPACTAGYYSGHATLKLR